MRSEHAAYHALADAACRVRIGTHFHKSAPRRHTKRHWLLKLILG